MDGSCLRLPVLSLVDGHGSNCVGKGAAGRYWCSRCDDGPRPFYPCEKVVDDLPELELDEKLEEPPAGFSVDDGCGAAAYEVSPVGSHGDLFGIEGWLLQWRCTWTFSGGDGFDDSLNSFDSC